MTWDLSLTWLRLRLVWNCWDSRLQHLRFDFPQMTLTWHKVVPKDLRLNLTLAISHDLRLDLRLVFQDLKHELDLSQMTCDLTWNSLKWLWLDINLSLMTWDLLERPHQLYVKIVETDLFFERFYKALERISFHNCSRTSLFPTFVRLGCTCNGGSKINLGHVMCITLNLTTRLNSTHMHWCQ